MMYVSDNKFRKLSILSLFIIILIGLIAFTGAQSRAEQPQCG